MNLRTVIIILSLACSTVHVNAQSAKIEWLKDMEDKLGHLLTEISNSRQDAERAALNEKFLSTWQDCLAEPASFHHAFASLKNMAILKSADNKLRVYSWNLPLNAGGNKYFGFVQYVDNKKTHVHQLIDANELPDQPEYRVLKQMNWSQVLYYDLITQSNKQKTYYTLLGWYADNLMSHQKVVDILTFNNAGRPRFGETIIRAGNQRVGRLTFTYSSQAIMNLRYDKSVNAIVYDQLSPLAPQYKGVPEFYGPDGSYGGMFFEKDRWNIVPNIDARNPKPGRKKNN